MSLESLASIFGLAPPNDSRTLTLSCARCLSEITASEADGRVRFTCSGGCSEEELLGALAEIEPKFADWWLSGGLTDGGEQTESHDSEKGGDCHTFRQSNGLGRSADNARAAGLDEAGGSAEKQTPRQTRTDGASTAPNRREQREDHPQNNGYESNGQVEARPDVFSWKMVLYELGKIACDKAIKEHGYDISAADDDTLLATVETLRRNPRVWQTNDPLGLSESEIAEELVTVAVALRKHYAPQLEVTVQNEIRVSTVEVEDAEHALVSNAEYLSRSAILERTYYTHHASLHVGGKHDGKTTCCKTEALMFASGGGEIWGRKAEATPVIYAASEDEYPSVRMDLLQMGWNPTVPLKMLRIKDNADRDFVLEDIAKAALQIGASLVYLDMLFDFTQIHDEISYTDTREQCGKVVQLAVAIKGHVKATHHSPKWMPDAAKAAKAALGSQGLAARFSPIVLSKCWIEPVYDLQGTLVRPGLYTIESTMTRDPRGAALPVTVVERYENGWAKSGGEFKSAMKWPIYCQRILDLFEMSEPGKRFTVNAVSKTLNIPHPEAQNAMYNMTEDSGNPRPSLERMKKIMGQGGGFTYGLIGHNTLDAAFMRAKDGNRS